MSINIQNLVHLLQGLVLAVTLVRTQVVSVVLILFTLYVPEKYLYIQISLQFLSFIQFCIALSSAINILIITGPSASRDSSAHAGGQRGAPARRQRAPHGPAAPLQPRQGHGKPQDLRALDAHLPAHVRPQVSPRDFSRNCIFCNQLSS